MSDDLHPDLTTMSAFTTAAHTAPATAIPQLLGAIAQAEAVLSVRLLTTAGLQESTDDDRLIDAKELARLMGVSPDHVYAHAASWPFTVRTGANGRGLRFHLGGFRRWARRQTQA